MPRSLLALFFFAAFTSASAAGVLSTLAAATVPDVSKDPAHAPAGAYKLETAHSLVLFSIGHLGLTDYYGRFDKLSGTLDFDSNAPEKSATSITIDTTSVDTPSDRLNNELKGDNVFATAKFPEATFKSTSVEKTGPDTGRITGDLTIKGVTKPVVLDVVFNGGAKSAMGGGFALGFRATAQIKRSDFDMTDMIWSPFVGDDVTLIIEAMFQQAKD
jgi:polyisoprenoid-binding protein YceI